MRIKYLLLLLVTLVSLSSTAGETSIINYKEKADIIVGSVISVVEPQGIINANHALAKRSNIVRLTYSRDLQTDVLDHGYWTYTVEYKIFDASNPSLFYTNSLTINYLPEEEQPTYVDLDSYSVITSADVVVEITDIEATFSADGDVDPYAIVSNPEIDPRIPVDIRLELETKSTRYYYLDASELPQITFNTQGNHTAYWTYIEGAEEYDLEYVFIDAEDDGFTATSLSSPFEYKEPTRISANGNSYKIDMTYPAGILYFRVRAVGRYINDGRNYSHIKTANWSYDNAGNTSALSYNVQPFENDYNWQYMGTFAEEGKHKSVISYFDGSFRSRQQQTNLSTNDVTVVGETKYDNEGRGVVNVLPVPKQDNTLNYVSKFNQAEGSTDAFEKGHFDLGSILYNANKLSITSGAGQYYSSNNPFIYDQFNEFIPDANGYAYTQVEYTRDNTGRVSKAGGVGPDHKLGKIDINDDERSSKIYYAKATSTELRRLFGKNIGPAIHYKKTMSVDANGQVSVAYMDEVGRTVATALAGISPNNLIALDYGDPYMTTLNLNEDNDYYYDDENYTEMIYVRPNNTEQTLYNFKYDVYGEIFQPTFDGTPISQGGIPISPTLCIDCEYELSITISDLNGMPVEMNYNGNDLFEIIESFSNADNSGCPDDYHPTVPEITFTATFAEVGNYTIHKKLTISEANLESDLQAALDAANLGATYLGTLISEYENNIDESLCDITCEHHCITYIKETTTLLEGSDDFNTAVQACLDDDDLECNASANTEFTASAELECDAIYQQIVADVSPGGDFYSQPTTSVFWQDVMTRAIYYGYIFTSGGVTYTGLADISNPVNFDDAWVPFLYDSHPGRCHYTLCNNLTTSRTYDKEQAISISTWTQAVANGYDDPLDYDSPGSSPAISNDPVAGFLGSTSPLLATMQSKIYTNYSLGLTLAQFVDPFFDGLTGLYSNSTSSITNTVYTANDITSYINGGTPTPIIAEMDALRWNFFRGLYQQLKIQALNDYYSDFPCSYDAISILNEPPVWSTQAEIDAFINNEITNLNSNCESICTTKVEYWMDELHTLCNGPTNEGEWNNIEAALSTYCNASCGLSNPFGAIISDMSNPDFVLLNDAFTDNGGCIDLITSDPYLSCENVTIGGYEIRPGFNILVDFFNDIILPGFTPSYSYSCYILSDYPSYNFGSFDPDLQIVIYSSSWFCIGKEPGNGGYGTCPLATGPSLARLYNSDIYNGWVPWGEIQEILNFTIDNGGSPGGSSYNHIKSTVRLDNQNIIEVYWHGQGAFQPSFDFEDLHSTDITRILLPITNCIPTALSSDFDYEIPNPDDIRQDCIEDQLAEAEYNATQQYEDEVREFTSAFINQYKSNCRPTENMYVTFEESEYHYTLFYYDQAGNLIQTVPPEGCHPLSSGNPIDQSGDWVDINIHGDWNGTSNPNHTYKTHYKYNSLNQLVKQNTPDAGESNFYYNDIGQLRFSQNSEQADLTKNYFSYMKYDNLGRVIEAGESTNEHIGCGISDGLAGQVNNMSYPAKGWEITKSYYDEIGAATSIQAEFDAGQNNLRNRISSVIYVEGEKGNPCAMYYYSDYTSASHYNYDIHGNVDELVQEDGVFKNLFGSSYKKTQYEYDLISGNVNQVTYQNNDNDQYMHRYYYDADNRLTDVETSRDGCIWDNDATYLYYLHGPLARVETGQDKVQGTDYAYTMHGWLKGVNSNTLLASNDLGEDGRLRNGANLGQHVARDAHSYSLGYYGGDYTPIGSGTIANSFLAADMPTPLTAQPESDFTNLYNGNISHMVTSLLDNLENAADLGVNYNAYKYDQLQRIKEMDVYNISDVDIANSNSFTDALNGGDYQTAYSYDKNGNITNLFRNGDGSLQMDDMDYEYYMNVAGTYVAYDPTSPPILNPGDYFTNRLANVADPIAVGNFTEDIDGITAGQLDYDAIGNLTQDLSEGIDNIEWMVNGKVKKITKSAATDLEFGYDPMGNRIRKIVKPNGTDQSGWTYHSYKLDASGTVMANYETSFINYDPGIYQATTIVKEFPMYGSKRLGINQIDGVVEQVTFAATINGGVFEMTSPSTTVALFGAISGGFASPNGLQFESGDIKLGTIDMNMSSEASFSVSSATDVTVIIEEDTLTGDTLLIPANVNARVISSSIQIDVQTTKRVDIESSTTVTPKAYDILISYPLVAIHRLGLKHNCKRILGNKKYEFSNHLGNVLSVTSDRKLGYEDSPENTNLESGFEGGDYNLFVNGDYSALIDPSNGVTGDAIKLENVQIGPSISKKVKPGDIVHVEIAAKDLTLTSSGALIVRLENPIGEALYVSGTIQEFSSTMSLVGWQQFVRNLTIPSTLTDVNNNPVGVNDIRVVAYPQNTSVNPAWFDNLKMDITPLNDEVYYTADVQSYSDYYPFGMLMPGRHASSDTYRYGFNGMEKDDEVAGTGNSYTTEFRQYDSRLGRWKSIDPVVHHQFSPYSAFDNNPIYWADPSGANAGDYYKSDGTYLGSDGLDDDKVYTATGTDKSKSGVDKFQGAEELKNNDGTNVGHETFLKFAAKAYNEDSDEIGNMAVASTIVNYINGKGSTLSSYNHSYASGSYKAGVTDAQKKGSREALINALTGGVDHSLGSTHWDGRDVLTSGLDHYRHRKANNDNRQGIFVPNDLQDATRDFVRKTFDYFANYKTDTWRNKVIYGQFHSSKWLGTVKTNKAGTLWTVNAQAGSSIFYIQNAKNVENQISRVMEPELPLPVDYITKMLKRLENDSK